MVIDPETFTPEIRARVFACGLLRYVEDMHKIARAEAGSLVCIYGDIEHARALLGHISQKVSMIERNAKTLLNLCGDKGRV